MWFRAEGGRANVQQPPLPAQSGIAEIRVDCQRAFQWREKRIGFDPKLQALPLTLGCMAFCMFLTAGVGGVFWRCEEGTVSAELARKGGEKAHEDAREVTADEDEDGAADEDGRAGRSALDVDRLGSVAALSKPRL